MEEQQYSNQYSQLWDILSTLTEIEIALQKANYIQQEVVHKYFGKLNIHSDKEKQQMVIRDYDRYDVFSQIVEDNLGLISNKITEIEEIVKASMDAEKRE